MKFTMAERAFIVSGKKLHFHGLFNMKELFQTIELWYADNGYSDMLETEHMEKVLANKKIVEIVYQPTKKLSEFAKVELRLLIKIDQLTRQVVEFEGHKLTINNGDVEFIIDAILTTDMEYRTQNKPFFFFPEILVDKFLFRTLDSKKEKIIQGDAHSLYTYVRQYLKATNYTKIQG
jgi:hypothetical protein